MNYHNKRTIRIVLLLMLSFFTSYVSMAQGAGKEEAATGNGNEWTKKKVSKWFNSSKWLGGLKIHPHKSIDQQEFAKQYQNHKEWWDKGFSYLKETDLASLKPGKYPIDGDNVYAIVTEAPLKDLDKSLWEAHKNYSDIHLMIKGKEKIGVAPFSSATVVTPYDATKDIGFYKAQGKYYIGDPETFFILFPENAHRPGLKVEGYDVVKKIVIKIRTGI